MLDKKKIVSIVIACLTLLFIFLLDIEDAFSHGYFTDSIKYDKIYEGDIEGYVDLENEDYTLTFSPIKKHFAGFVLYLADQPSDNLGTIELTVKNAKGSVIDTIEVDISKIQDRDDYKVYSHKNLKKGEKYSLTISAEACAVYPKLILIDQDYITGECNDNNLLLGYAYKESTFNVTEKMLITLFSISILLLLIYFINKKEKNVPLYHMGLFILLMTIMAWNYSFNTFGYSNTNYTDFDKFSENLVTTTIKADREGLNDLIPMGLNGISDVTGNWYATDKTFLTDETWTKGYNNSQSQILFRNSYFINSEAIVGNYVQFENGEEFAITEVSSDNSWTTITLNAGRPLNWWKYGDLSNVKFIDSDGNMLATASSYNYVSHYGLQGKIYKHMGRLFSIEFLKVLTAIATAISLLMVVYLIWKKYNVIFAGVFYVTFLLGQWIVNFANNLYWVEFTWFLPMVVGIFCAWKIDNKKCRIISYVGAYFFVTIKSLCGYEYISVVMMGLITFLLVDLIKAIVLKDKEKIKRLVKTILIIGIVALAGFSTAICIHAPNKPGADGNILTGIKLIFEEDVLRRTSGGDINTFDELPDPEGYAQLASVWETSVKYFHFDTEIITGIGGSFFPIFCVIPLLIFMFDIKKRNIDVELMALYVVSFISTMSWFVLAKSHSYVHTHLNYVLWYFGFIQVCLYTVANKVITIYRKLSKGD